MRNKRKVVRANKYLIIPGFVRSVNDGEMHFISGAKLITLYNLNPQDCQIADVSRPHWQAGYILKDWICLEPRTYGDYQEHLQDAVRPVKPLKPTNNKP